MRFAGILATTATISVLLTACQSKPPADDAAARVAAAEKLAQSTPTADSRINLALVYFQTGNFQGCINASNDALKLRPEDALAYNNIAACQGGLSHWDEEIKAAQHALRINPDFQLAKNNLAWAISQKDKGK